MLILPKPTSFFMKSWWFWRLITLKVCHRLNQQFLIVQYLFVVWVVAGSPPSTGIIGFSLHCMVSNIFNLPVLSSTLLNRTNTDNVVQTGIIKAINELKDRKGLSMIAIKNFMQANLPKDKKWLNATFLSGLKAGVA